MRRVAFYILALSLTLFLAQCGGDGGSTPEDTGGPAADTTGDAGGTDVAVDDTGTPIEDTVKPEDLVTPPDGADVKPPDDIPGDHVQPDDAGDVQVPPDVPVVECTINNDCLELIPAGDLCAVATCEDGVCDVHQKDCDDENPDDPCTLNVCNPQTGLCQHPLNPACAVCQADTEDPICSDQNDCTLDMCNSAGTGCVYTAKTQGCDDGNPCTSGEHCMPGPTGGQVAVCGGGEPLPCDDADGCTIDWCDPIQAGDACRHLTLEYEGCETGDPIPCSAEISCPVIPGNPCIVYECNETDGVCEATFPTAACNDNALCTTQDTCFEGVCLGGDPPDCDDGDIETVDSCIPGFGCVNTPTIITQPCATVSDCTASTNACKQTLCHEGYCVTLDVTGSCEDGDFCTVDDFCQAGQCLAGPPRDCSLDTSVECPAGASKTCDTDAVACVCQGGGTCNIPVEDQTGCESGSDCNDGDPCTVDSCLTFLTPSQCTCVEQEACRCNPLAADGGHGACDDADRFTTDLCCQGPNDAGAGATAEQNELCQQAGVCIHPLGYVCEEDEQCTGEGDNAACDDGDKCTLDICGQLPGGESFCCDHPAMGPPTCLPCTTDAQCSDGNPCTPDRCGADGKCDPPGPEDPALCPCEADEDCEDDGNICTTERCVERNCEYENNTNACEDGDNCTDFDTCDVVTAECIGTARICDDGNPCTADRCDANDGCVSEQIDPPPAGCEETCLESDNPDQFCADGNPCTADTCLDNGTCEHRDLNAEEPTPLCQPLPCRDEVDCDDGNPCTVDACVDAETPLTPDPDNPPSKACVYSRVAECAIPAQLACGEPAECDPANCMPDSASAFCNAPTEACPSAYCDAEAGCRFLPTAGCDIIECTPASAFEACWDQQPCTVDECGPDGMCVPSEERQSAHPADSLFERCFPCQTAADCIGLEESSVNTDDPCLTIECIIPDPFPTGVTPVGVCYAHIDQEAHPNGCEDYDLCTIDACVAGGGCTHTSRGADCRLCSSDTDCDDLDPCTEDTCDRDPDTDTGFGCTHVAEPGCVACLTDQDCPGWGGTICERQTCMAGRCGAPEFGDDPTQGPVCLTDTPCGACAGGGPIAAVCVPGTDDCLLLPNARAAGYTCTADDQCFVPEACKQGACVGGACVISDTPGCTPEPCTTTTDCEDDSLCSYDICAGGFCVHIIPSEDVCCDTLDDCPADEPYDACSLPACTPRQQCGTAPLGDTARCGVECESDADCTRTCSEDTGGCVSFCLTADECYDWDCAQGACNARGRCVWFDGDCTACESDNDCLDPDPCTIDTCNAGQCTHTPDAGCSTVACDADNLCVGEDDCTLGMCLSGACVWFPNPYCL